MLLETKFHHFVIEGEHFLATESGGLYILDEDAWNALKGDLSKREAVEELEFIAREENTRQLLQLPPPDRLLKALCLHISHRCNLACRYCFASYASASSEEKDMSWEIARTAIDFLLKNSGKKKNLQVDFFGGEPLLNFEVVKKAVKYGKEESAREGKSIKFTLTTNALLLDDEKIDFLNRENISLILSLDGSPAVHDRMRLLPSGKGSHNEVLTRIKKAVSSRRGEDYYIRGTYTRDSMNFFDSARYFLDEGLNNFSLEPVAARGEEPYSIRVQDLPFIEKEYEKLAKLFIERSRAKKPFIFFHFMMQMDKPLCVTRRLLGCGAGVEYLAVAPEGKLYPCHQFVGRAEFLMGDVFSGSVDKTLRQKFADANLFAKEGCPDCWAKYYCSGGCHANAYFINGDILKPDPIGCHLQKKRTECALYIQAKK